MSGNTESVLDTQTQRAQLPGETGHCTLRTQADITRNISGETGQRDLTTRRKLLRNKHIVSVIVSDRMTMSTEILKEEDMGQEDGIIESEEEDIDVGSNESYRYILSHPDEELGVSLSDF